MTVNIYTYSSDTVASGTDFISWWAYAAAGSSTVGIFGGGYSYPSGGYGAGGIPFTYYSNTYRYTYSSDTTSGGTNLGTARDYLTATGSSTFGIFGDGIIDNNYYTKTNVTDKYTYSNDSRVAGTNLGTARSSLAATGSSTVGIFGAGSGTAITDKYRYSDDTVSSGTNLGTARSAPAAPGSTPNSL